MRNKILQVLFIFFCLAAPLCSILGLTQISSLFSLSLISPNPVVFTSFRGFETFAADYKLQLTTDNNRFQYKIDAFQFSKLEGGFNRRIVYGSMLSYGALFESKKELEFRNSFLNYAFCDPAIISSIFLSKKVKRIKLLAKDRENSLEVEYKCL